MESFRNEMADLAFSKRYLLASVVVFLLLSCLTDALVLEEEFAGKVVTDLKVDLTADQVWALFRKPNFYTILSKFIFGYYQTIDYVTGKGGAGSIVNITITPAYGGSYWLFKVVEINDKTKTRVERRLRGERLDSGFTSFETRYTVVKKTTTSCIIRETTSFKIQQKSLSNATGVELNWSTSAAVADYVNQNPVRSTYHPLNEEYSGKVGTEMKVNLPAKDIWNVFRSKDFGHLIQKLMPGYFKQIDYVTGDGGVGTVLNVTLQPASGSLQWQEKIIEIDDRTMTRRLRQVQGYRLDSGFTMFDTVYRAIPKARNSCVISAVRPFKVKPASISNALATILPSWSTAITVANYVNS